MLVLPSWRPALLRGAALLVPVAMGCGQTDPSIQTAVGSQLLVNSTTAPLSLDISVTRGVVRLAGEVTSREQERRALELARSIRGVKDVIDDMDLSDETIVASVTKALAADPLVGEVPIEVDSSSGHIRLISDQTSKEERTRAMAIATKVDGVKHVEDRMR